MSAAEMREIKSHPTTDMDHNKDLKYKHTNTFITSHVIYLLIYSSHTGRDLSHWRQWFIGQPLARDIRSCCTQNHTQ